MNPITFALRNPITIMVMVAGIIVGSVLAVTRMKIDIFPALNTPVIYVCQPYGGMNPRQMEGLLTNYYEFHFLYVGGIKYIESKNIQSMTLLKLHFHPNTDMSQALAEVVASVNRSRFMMPPGTVPPFVSRVDSGNASLGYLVLSSETKAIKDIQDIATLKVRPLFANIPGISTPPAFGGNQRAIVVEVDPDQLRAYNLTPADVTEALSKGNSVSPAGNMRIGDRMYMVQTNAMVGANPREEMKKIPLTLGANPIFLENVATISDSSDIPAGYVNVDGRRSVYMLVTKRSDASTLDVIHELRKNLPKIQENVPEDVKIEFAFDQSPIVTNAMWGVGIEGVIGAALTGVMVLLFLRDWRSVIVVITNIPLAILGSLIGLWLTGQTLNIMALGGLALAVGILVDEATVEVENIHSQMSHGHPVARAVRRGNQETAVPRLLALFCILSVFLPAAFMEGSARALFTPLALAVGFAMITSYFLSSTFVPVMSVWLLKGHDHFRDSMPRVLTGIHGLLAGTIMRVRYLAIPAYLIGIGFGLTFLLTQIGTEIFPSTDSGQFVVRFRGPTGTRIERTEQILQQITKTVAEKVDPKNVRLTVGYAGLFPTNYPVQGLYQWTGGPEEGFVKIALNAGSGWSVDQLKRELREELPGKVATWLRKTWNDEGLSNDKIEDRLTKMKYSFESADLISEVMSFGSPTPIELVISGPKIDETLAYSKKIQYELGKIPSLRDLQMVQAQDYPTIDINIDRVQAARAGITSDEVAQSLIPATASSRYMHPIYWRDPNSGQAYIVQVQVPIRRMNSTKEIELTPVRGHHGDRNEVGTGESMMGTGVMLRDVASIKEVTIPGAIDRYNMRRFISLTANLATNDLGSIRSQIDAAILSAGEKPRGASVDIRGQLEPLQQLFTGLRYGLLLTVIVIFLLLTAYFQSIRLSLSAVAAVPAAMLGIGLILWVTGTSLNLQSFIGSIMAVGVAVANAIMLTTFAEKARHTNGGNATIAALDGAKARLRPILMTSIAMIAGMIPMAIGISEGGDSTKPLGLAVIGGLGMATIATLVFLPAVYAILMRGVRLDSASLDPDDPESSYYDRRFYPAPTTPVAPAPVVNPAFAETIVPEQVSAANAPTLDLPPALMTESGEIIGSQFRVFRFPTDPNPPS
jgi:multidrug efflux pump subunit AcrB